MESGKIFAEAAEDTAVLRVTFENCHWIILAEEREKPGDAAREIKYINLSKRNPQWN